MFARLMSVAIEKVNEYLKFSSKACYMFIPTYLMHALIIIVGCVLPHTETRDAASGNRVVLEEFINSL